MNAIRKNAAIRIMEDIIFLRPLEDQGVVYFLEARDQDRVKIGYSASLKRRLSKLGTSSSAPLSLLGAIAGTKQTEAELHRRFCDARRNGEWFQLSGPVETFLEEVLFSEKAILRQKWAFFRA